MQSDEERAREFMSTINDHKFVKAVRVLAEHFAAVRSDEREECAKVAVSMVVGGRAWNEGQAIAGKALLACADAIRARTP